MGKKVRLALQSSSLIHRGVVVAETAKGVKKLVPWIRLVERGQAMVIIYYANEAHFTEYHDQIVKELLPQFGKKVGIVQAYVHKKTQEV